MAEFRDLIREFGLEDEIRTARIELALAWEDVPGRALKALRLRAGLEQRDLAARLQVSPRRVAHLESGRADMSDDIVYDLAQALGVSCSQVIRAATLDHSASA